MPHELRNGIRIIRPQKKLLLIGDDPVDRKEKLENIQTWMRAIVEDNNTTPDLPLLQKNKWSYVFIYDTMKRGFRHGNYLDDCPAVGVGYTQSPMFRMWQTEEGYPIILANPTSGLAGRVYGQIYRVPPEKILELDFANDNRYKFKRLMIPIKICIPNSDNFHITPVWAYVGLQSYWNQRFNTLRSIERLTANKDKGFHYYNFRKIDDVVPKSRAIVTTEQALLH